MPEVPQLSLSAIQSSRQRPRPDSSFLLMAAAELDKAGMLRMPPDEPEIALKSKTGETT